MEKSQRREVRQSRRRPSGTRDDVGRQLVARDEELVDETLLEAIDTISDSIEPHLERWDRILDDIEASLASVQSHKAVLASQLG